MVENKAQSSAGIKTRIENSMAQINGVMLNAPPAIWQAGRMGISAGRTLSHAFSGTSIIPPMVVSMLRVGESTGGLDLALGNVSYLYTRQAREAVQNLQATLQPILTVVLGLILAMVMVFTLGPLYDSVIGNARK